MWHQLDEVIKLSPARVLEIGPGPGIFKATASALGIRVETLDIDPELHPDHVASVFQMPFEDNAFDVACAFQMLEHLPFAQSLIAFSEIARVAKYKIILSLPDAATRWPMSIYIPRIGDIKFSIPKPRIKPKTHQFDGEHYWEISKHGYHLQEVTKQLLNAAPVTLSKTYITPENPYHRFFVFSKKTQ